jgi:hypothetical protein
MLRVASVRPVGAAPLHAPPSDNSKRGVNAGMGSRPTPLGHFLSEGYPSTLEIPSCLIDQCLRGARKAFEFPRVVPRQLTSPGNEPFPVLASSS